MKKLSIFALVCLLGVSGQVLAAAVTFSVGSAGTLCETVEDLCDDVSGTSGSLGTAILYESGLFQMFDTETLSLDVPVAGASYDVFREIRGTLVGSTLSFAIGSFPAIVDADQTILAGTCSGIYCGSLPTGLTEHWDVVSPIVFNLSSGGITVFDDGAGNSPGPTATGTTFTLTQTGTVPVPPAVWLFGSALGLLGWLRHKQAA